jgi:DNA-binding NarL/FixJ family response regulator
MRSVSRVSELRQGFQFCGQKTDRRRGVSPWRPVPVVLRGILRPNGRRPQSLPKVTGAGGYRARFSTLVTTSLLTDSVRLTRKCLDYFLRSRLPPFDIHNFCRADNALKRRPGVVVANLNLALIGDSAANAYIAEVVSATRCPQVLALLHKTEIPAAYQASEADASGVLPNDCCASSLVAAIHLLLERRTISSADHIVVAHESTMQRQGTPFSTRYLQSRP